MIVLKGRLFTLLENFQGITEIESKYQTQRRDQRNEKFNACLSFTQKSWSNHRERYKLCAAAEV